jgi:hypothetical protein
MVSGILKFIIILAVPSLVTAVGNYALMHLSGRNKFPETGDANSKPLNVRWGYRPVQAIAYWSWLNQQPAAAVAERRFLLMDLLFAIVYGGAMLASLFLAWLWHSIDVKWLLAPALLAIFSDWTENLVHLRQFDHFRRGERTQDFWIRLASIATIAKWIFIYAGGLMILAAAILMLVSIFSGSGLR